jgi:hypothetical protein
VVYVERIGTFLVHFGIPIAWQRSKLTCDMVAAPLTIETVNPEMLSSRHERRPSPSPLACLRGLVVLRDGNHRELVRPNARDPGGSCDPRRRRAYQEGISVDRFRPSGREKDQAGIKSRSTENRPVKACLDPRCFLRTKWGTWALYDRVPV